MTAPRTIAALFFETAKRFQDRPFLHAPAETAALYALDKADYTYDEAHAIVEAWRGDYSRLGVAAGDRVGVALDNRPEFFLRFLALNAIGASIVPLSGALSDAERAYQINHGDCCWVVERSGLIAQPRAIPAPKIGEDEAALLYTSGTTGTPKGCILSNDYFLAIGEHYTTRGGYVAFEEGRERIITPLPVTHMNALACSFMAAIRTGGCLIQLDRFHPKSWWKTVRESRATIMHYLGVMPAMLLQAPPAADDDFSRQIKFAFGAGCDPRHHAAFETRFGVRLIEAWAMTETGAGAWITASHEPRHVGTRCFGRAPEGIDWRLVDEEDRDMPAGEPGELLVRRRGMEPRRHFFSGYWKDEAATGAAWKDGWFHTGDVVRVDPEGSFCFVDRRKNVIRRSGENIAAIEVESVIAMADGVRACVIVPVPDDIRGEEVMALVVPAEGVGDAAHARAIFDAAAARLAYFKAPGHVAFVDALPMTASEKIRRGAAKEIARDLLARRAAFDFTALKKQKRSRPSPRRRGYEGVAVAAPVTVPYQRYSDQPAHWWIGRALKALIDRARLSPADIDGLCAASFTLAPDTAVMLTQYFGLAPRWLDHLPMGGASGVAALRRAARAVEAGDAEIVACVAGDANDRGSFRTLAADFSRFTREASFPYGAAGPNAPFALITRAYMNAYGATREDFGRLCVAQRDYALQVPHALMKTPLTIDAYLSARAIAEPLHLYDCVMPCAGAEAFLVLREERARDLGLPFATILSTIERHNAFAADDIQVRTGVALDRDALWAMAGVGRADVDFVETYDDYPAIAMMQIEDLGFCPKGAAKDFLRSAAAIPHNTSGGQLSVGQAGAAGGFLGLVEALRQLTGETLGARLAKAKIGAVSGFGIINYDRGLSAAAAILAEGVRCPN